MTAAGLQSCELETSGNDELDGLWHLEQVDTIATGGTCDMMQQKMYWIVQLKLLETEDKGGGHRNILWRFNKTSDSLTLHSPYIYNREEGDEVLTDVSLITPYGVSQLEETFHIDRLTSNRMQLSSRTLVLRFKKIG